MCGIFGEFYFNGHSISLQQAIRKLDMLAHRGPDGYGCEYGNLDAGQHSLLYCRGGKEESIPLSDTDDIGYFLGHRRLSIVDLNDNAFQPIESHDGRYSIVFNGEIYNFIELRKELLKAGCVFKTDHSDTEVLLNAYIQWGTKCLERFIGMFAFSILDRHNRQVFLARDRIGKKPMYYHFDRNRFAFSSELWPLLSQPCSHWRIDRQALCCYMAFGYIPHPLTIIESIHKLPPASFAVLDLFSGNFDIKEYWDVKIHEDTGKSAEQFLEEIDSLLTESVSIRLRADVPLGAFISGGTDSTLIVKKIHDISSLPCDIFGADFPQPEQSEGRHIAAVAKRYSQNLHLSMIDSEHADNVEEIIKVFDEPFDGGSSIALFELFRQVRGGFKVILTGDGGDELFAGYPRYTQFQTRPQLAGLFSIIAQPAKLVAGMTGHYGLGRKADGWLCDEQGDFWSRYLFAHARFDLAELVLNRKDYHPEQAEIFETVRRKIPAPGSSPIKSLQYLELKTILPGRMLYKLDRFSMRYGIEARSPLLDHRLAELAFTIPSHFSISKRSTKILLKKLLECDFPSSFVHRQKHGFGNPLSHWFSDPKSKNLFSVLNRSNSMIFNYMDYDKLHARIPQIKKGFSGGDAKILWRLLVLGHYLENMKDTVNGNH